jgi:hypothetical protein
MRNVLVGLALLLAGSLVLATTASAAPLICVPHPLGGPWLVCL